MFWCLLYPTFVISAVRFPVLYVYCLLLASAPCANARGDHLVSHEEDIIRPQGGYDHRHPLLAFGEVRCAAQGMCSLTAVSLRSLEGASCELNHTLLLVVREDMPVSPVKRLTCRRRGSCLGREIIGRNGVAAPEFYRPHPSWRLVKFT